MNTPKHLCFILSAQRSGSTLLRVLLDKLPGVISLPETFFWEFRNNYIQADLSNKESLSSICNAWLDFFTIRKWDINHGELYDSIMGSNASSWKDIFELSVKQYIKDVCPEFKGNTWVEKSPSHIFYQKDILSFYPNAKFIYLLRDPRDQAASLKTCSWSTSNVYTIARVWRKGVRSFRVTSNNIVIKYENLVTKPEKELEKVCELLNQPFDEALLAPVGMNFSKMGSQVTNVELHKKAYQEITPQSIGNWRKKLSVPDRDVEVIEHVCHKEMIEYGYLLSREKVKKMIYPPILYQAFGLLFKKLMRY